MTDFFQFLVNGLVSGGIYAIVAIGFVTIYQVSKVINLAQGEFLMLGGLIAVTLLGTGIPYGLAFILSVLLVTLLGMFIQRFVVRYGPISNQISLIILTIGLSILIRGIASMIWGKDAYALEPFTSNEPITFSGISISQQSLWVILAVFLLLFVFWYLMNKTLLGKKMYACSVNLVATRLMGINPHRMALLAFAMSAASGAIAGIAIAPLNVTSYDVGILLGIKGFSAAILGGLQNPVGVAIAGFLIGLMESFGTGFISSGLKDAIVFLLIIVVLMIKPTGLFGEPNVGKGGL